MRLPAIRLPLQRLPALDRHARAQLVEALPHLFYALMTFALLAVVFGSAGFALLFLILGGCAHVARVGVEEWVEAGFEVEPALDAEIEVRRARPAARPAPEAGPALAGARRASPRPRSP